MSCGLPVIVGNLTAPQEYVPKDSGILIPPDDIAAMANSMQQLIHQLNSYQPAGIRQHIIANFSFDVFGHRLNTIYEGLYKS